jgi:DNA polymerase-1
MTKENKSSSDNKTSKTGPEVTRGDHVFLVDGSAYIFRAYHALPPLTRKSDGLPIGAVSGFCNMLFKLLKEADETQVGVKPTHFAVIFDASSKSFRNDLYDQYKANRSEPPEDLRPQFPIIRDAVRAFNVACIEKEGFEADDLIATYASIARDAGADVTIVSSDKDLMQLVDDNILLYDQMKDKRIGPAEVIEKFGVGPEKMIDLQALAGDSIDNIPGVPGIGVKTAAQLLEEFGDLDTLLEKADTIKQNKRRENLIEFADQARLSRNLVRLDCTVALDVPIGDLRVESLDGPKLIAFLKAMEFNTLTKRVAKETETEVAEIEAQNLKTDWEKPEEDVTEVLDATLAPNQTPSALAQLRQEKARSEAIDTTGYSTVKDLKTLEEWLLLAKEQGHFAIDTETTSLNAMQAELVGVSLALKPGKACYIPLAHKEGEGDLLGGGKAEGQIDFDKAIKALKPLLEDTSVLKIGQNVKYDWLILKKYGIEMAPFDDTMLMSYVCDAGKGNHGMDDLAERWLGHSCIPFKEVAGTGRNAITFDQVSIEKATVYAAEDADVTLRLWQVLKPRLPVEKATTVYETLERPLVSVLAKMEERGVKIDRQMLSRLSGEFAQTMRSLEAEIYDLAGENFNVGSPKQLGEILFDKMGLPGGKKTKTGAWATPADALETLAAEGHELPVKVLEWRQLSKLRSTYTEALANAVHPKTNRVHTSYALASTTTGRLSSSDPNLQNIPVRTTEGRKIRRTFIAEKDCKIISADYSQIELRILAHVADIPQLKKAFADGQDIHATTASEMFGVPIKDMDPLIRRRAKAINFGIVYGISAFGLANQLSIPREEAGSYIKTYFERFPGIKDYMDATKKFARDHGYVETVFGRRAHYPDIKASNHSLRAFNERAAINAPIQGSAADIIRRAMIRMDDALVSAGLKTKMLLQVHDELIFEAPEKEVEKAIAIITKTMIESPEPVLKLSVPLEVDARAADNWEEAH